MRTLFRAVLQTFVSSMVVQGLTALAGIFLARRLGPDGRGELTAVLLWPPLFLTIVHLGFGHAIQYLYPQLTAKERRSMFGNLLVMALTAGIPGAVLAWFLMPSLLHAQPAYVVTLAKIYALHLPMGMVADFSFSLLLASQRFGRVNILRIGNSVVYLTGLLLLALGDQVRVTPVFLVQLLSGHVVFGVALLYLKRADALWVRPDWPLLKRCLRYALRTHLGTICSLTSSQGDRMLLAAFVAPRELGLYAIAVNASLLPYPLVQAVTSTMLPAVAAEAESERRRTALRVARLSLPMLALIYGTLFVLAQQLVLSLYGEPYAEAVAAARILMLGTVAFGAADVLRQALRVLNMPVLASAGDLAGLAATVGLLTWLLPRFGYLGAAMASLGAYVLTYVVLVVCAVLKADIRLSELLFPSRADLEVLWLIARERWDRVNDHTPPGHGGNAAR